MLKHLINQKVYLLLNVHGGIVTAQLEGILSNPINNLYIVTDGKNDSISFYLADVNKNKTSDNVIVVDIKK